MDAPTIIHADINEINETDDNDNDIISVVDIPAQADHYPLKVPDTSDKDDEGKDDKDDDEDNNAPQENNPSNEAGGELEGEEAPGVEDETPGVRRSQRKNKGVTNRFDNYGLMMYAQRRARGGQRRATIRDGLMLFLADNLSDVKPVPEEDREEHALGIALVHYSMGAEIKMSRTMTPHKKPTHQMSREGNQKERKLQEWKTKLQECANHSTKTKM